jgi:hypothetical protein
LAEGCDFYCVKCGMFKHAKGAHNWNAHTEDENGGLVWKVDGKEGASRGQFEFSHKFIELEYGATETQLIR